MPEDAFIERFRDFLPKPTDSQINFAKEAFNVITNDIDTGTLTVFPARCGLGKSTIVKALISYFTQFETYQYRYKDSVGAVVITDKLDNLNSYQDQPKHIKSLWGTPYETHKDYCTYIAAKEKEDDIAPAQQLVNSQYKPIVLLSTQRYFQMDSDQREMLFTYRLGNSGNQEKFKREIVIFDEKPYFYDLKKITVKNFNDVATALQQGIPKNDPDKDWLLQEYWAFRNKMSDLLRLKERSKKNTDRFYWKDKNTQNITSNDDQFFILVSKYKKQINKKYDNAINDLKSFKQLMTDGAFFITEKEINEQPNENYDTYFQLYQDHRDKFFLNQNKAKFFVFDATSDIDPDYKNDYVNLIDFSHYNQKINMTINQLDVNTSKNKICNYRNKDIVAALGKNLMQYNRKSIGGLFVITYKNIEDQFSNEDFEASYFGGLKGTNDYMNFLQLGHVGLNRFSNFQYFITWLYQNPQLFELLQNLDENASRKFIEESIKLSGGMFENSQLNDIMIQSILADFEQNIFRTAIRKYDNQREVHIYTYWNCQMYQELNRLIKDRYADYGVTIEFLGTPPEIKKLKIKNRKTTKKTNPQKIIEWYETQPKGREFKISELLNETSLNNQQFQKAKENNPALKQLFEDSKIGRSFLKVI